MLDETKYVKYAYNNLDRTLALLDKCRCCSCIGCQRVLYLSCSALSVDRFFNYHAFCVACSKSMRIDLNFNSKSFRLRFRRLNADLLS